MLFVLQSFFGFDITVYLLPFITLLLTVSFAIAPMVGNVFLAFAFVFLMSPYDLGHRVQFGNHNPYQPPVIGYIKSVSLLYTIVTTLKDETVKIPNHTLYGEKIFNMTETTGALHEFTFSFNIFGQGTSEMDKINMFFQRLKHYTLRESNQWKFFLLTANGMNSVENSMTYTVYVIHREGWHMYKAVHAAKVEFWAAVKRLREELNLTFVRNPTPVVLVDTSGEGADIVRAVRKDSESFDAASDFGLMFVSSKARAGTIAEDEEHYSGRGIATSSASTVQPRGTARNRSNAHIEQMGASPEVKKGV